MYDTITAPKSFGITDEDAALIEVRSILRCRCYARVSVKNATRVLKDKVADLERRLAPYEKLDRPSSEK